MSLTEKFILRYLQASCGPCGVVDLCYREKRLFELGNPHAVAVEFDRMITYRGCGVARDAQYGLPTNEQLLNCPAYQELIASYKSKP